MAPRFVYWPFAGAAVFLVVFAGLLVVQAWRMRRWLATTAVVTGSRLESDDDSNFTPYLSYEYVVDGQRRTGEAAVNNSRYYPQKKALAVLAKHPVGSQVQAYYSPEDPTRSTLRRHGWMVVLQVALLLWLASRIAQAVADHLT